MKTDLQPNEDIREAILECIRMERVAQVSRWGLCDHSMPEFLSILTEEVGEAASEANKYHWGHKDKREALDALEAELIQTAAVAVQIIEAVQRERGEVSDGD